MLYIDPNSEIIKQASATHFRIVQCFIRKKLGVESICKDKKCPVCTSKLQKINGLTKRIKENISKEGFLDRLLNGLPKVIIEANKELCIAELPDYDIIEYKILKTKSKDEKSAEDKIKIKKYKALNKKLKAIFDYEGWLVSLGPNDYYGAYQLAQNLDKRSCIYCNRTYTITQTKVNKDNIEKKLVRPQFDHWYSKENYPALGLSFFNLIPSCSICNSSVKGRKEFSLDDYIHPYLDNIVDDFKFS